MGTLPDIGAGWAQATARADKRASAQDLLRKLGTQGDAAMGTTQKAPPVAAIVSGFTLAGAGDSGPEYKSAQSRTAPEGPSRRAAWQIASRSEHPVNHASRDSESALISNRSSDASNPTGTGTGTGNRRRDRHYRRIHASTGAAAAGDSAVVVNSDSGLGLFPSRDPIQTAGSLTQDDDGNERKAADLDIEGTVPGGGGRGDRGRGSAPMSFEKENDDDDDDDDDDIVSRIVHGVNGGRERQGKERVSRASLAALAPASKETATDQPGHSAGADWAGGESGTDGSHGHGATERLPGAVDDESTEEKGIQRGHGLQAVSPAVASASASSRPSSRVPFEGR